MRLASLMVREIDFEERNRRRGIGLLGFIVSASVTMGSQFGRWVSDREDSSQQPRR